MIPHNIETYMIDNPYKDYLSDVPDMVYKPKPLPGTKVNVRTEPKINRNEICPKCNSKKKFKKCCGK